MKSNNSISLIIVFLFSITLTTAQEIKMCGYQGYQTVEEVNSACDLYNKEKSETIDATAITVVDAILDKIGLFRNFEIEECEDINNALAVTMPIEGGNIERFILYDDEFFKKVSSSTGTDWGLTSILAHEVGHHLNGHTLKTGGSNHKIELQADEFSGFVLARMKCSLADAQSAVSNLLPDEASATHPAKVDRLAAIEKGWNRGNGKTIQVKKITKINDEKEITAEMVLANYIDAIGGQEKVKSIKTLTKKYKTIVSQKLKSRFWYIGKDINKKKYEIAYLSPIKYKLYSIDRDSWGRRPIFEKETILYYEKLVLNEKGYGKSYNNKTEEIPRWGKMKMFNTNKNKVSSYIDEFSDLISNVEMKYLGIKKIGKKKYHVIEIPKSINALNVSNSVYKDGCTKSETKYFDIKTGLLYKREVISTCNASDKKTNKVSDAVYTDTQTFTDYKKVDGILFPFKVKTATTSQSFEDDDVVKDIRNFKYSEIIVNPTLNPDDFDPTK